MRHILGYPYLIFTKKGSQKSIEMSVYSFHHPIIREHPRWRQSNHFYGEVHKILYFDSIPEMLKNNISLVLH
jgi:hypothetical protein